MTFGSALHCLVLEGQDIFTERYVSELRREDVPDALDTIGDIREWIVSRGGKPKGTRKNEIIAQAIAIDPAVEIWDAIKDRWNEAAGGRLILKAADYERVFACASALLREPFIEKMLAEGIAEDALLWEQEGTPMKAKLDWRTPDHKILDLKSFSARRGKSIDESVAGQILYEFYYRQAFIYHTGYKAIHGKAPRYFLAFVESEEPHEVRIRELKPTNSGTANVYWQRAQIEVRHFCRIWSEHMKEFGTQPWRRDQESAELLDEEMPGLSY
jgi:hypothetical protein